MELINKHALKKHNELKLIDVKGNEKINWIIDFFILISTVVARFLSLFLSTQWIKACFLRKCQYFVDFSLNQPFSSSWRQWSIILGHWHSQSISRSNSWTFWRRKYRLLWQESFNYWSRSFKIRHKGSWGGRGNEHGLRA